jgi:hypothetical protein
MNVVRNSLHRVSFLLGHGSDITSRPVSAGLGINLLHQNFERDNGGSRIDFGDFRSDTVLNMLAGVRHRVGTFLELKTSVYSAPSPTLRLMVGYNLEADGRVGDSRCF